MRILRTIAPLALIAGLALSSSAVADSTSSAPRAQTAGGDVPPLTPAILNVPIIRTDKALERAALQIEQGNDVRAGRSLAAVRRYLTRSSNGSRYLIDNPPPVAEEARATAGRLTRLAHRAVRNAKRHADGGWIRARASGDVVGPTFADTPTAVFSVLTSQYSAVTQTVDMLNDATAAGLNDVTTTLDRALTLRDRLVQFIHTNAPPPDAEEAQEEGVPTFDVVMPGLVVLIDDELQQLRAETGDASLPAAAQAAIRDAIRTDRQIENDINTFWPPAAED